MIKKLKTIKVLLNTDGTLNLVESPVKLHTDSYNFVKIGCAVPETANATSNAFVKVYTSTIDLSGAEIWSSQTYPLLYQYDKVINNFNYHYYESMLPQEFCATAGDIMITFAYAYLNSAGEAVALLPSATLNLNVSGQGFNPNGVVIAQNDETVARVNLLSTLSVLKVDISKTLPLNAKFLLNEYKTPFYEFYTSNNLISPLSYSLPVTATTIETKQCYVIAKEILPDLETPGIVGYQTEFAYCDEGVFVRTNKYNISQASLGNYVLLENGAWEVCNKEYFQTQIDAINQIIKERQYFLGYFATEEELLLKYPNGTTVISPNSSVGVYSTNTYWEFGDDRIWNDTLEPLPQDQTLLSDEMPLMNGLASAGVGARASRVDHIHPSDTSKADFGEVVKLESEFVQIVNSDLAIDNSKKIYGVKKDDTQCVLIGIGKYQNLEQVEVGSVTEHLNLNTLDNVTYDIKTEEGPLVKKTIASTDDLIPIATDIITNTGNIETNTSDISTIKIQVGEANSAIKINSDDIATNANGISLKLDKSSINENYLIDISFSMNGDTGVSTVSIKNPVTGISQDFETTVANSASSINTGFMTSNMVVALNQAIADIESLKDVGIQLKSFQTYEDAEAFDWDTLTESINKNDYFIVVQDETRPEPETGLTTKYICVNTTTPITTVKNFKFQTVVNTPNIQIATEAIVGGLLSTNANGYIFVEADGSAKLVGYDALITSINNIAQSLIAETNRAKLAEGVNATAIADEIIRAITAEQLNTEAIDAEKTRAESAETFLAENKADKTELPTKTSELVNDSNFATTSELPTKTSQLTNDSNFAITSQIPTRTSQLQNDSDFITEYYIFNIIYPVSSIYLTTNSINPSNYFWGEWVAWGSGRVPIAVGNNGETNYINAEQTGGSENTNAEHTHTAGSHTHTMAPNGSSSVTTIGSGQDPQTTGLFRITDKVNSKWSGSGAGAYSTLNLNAHDHYIDPAGTIPISGSGINGGNRMPFITCFMWKRIN